MNTQTLKQKLASETLSMKEKEELLAHIVAELKTLQKDKKAYLAFLKDVNEVLQKLEEELSAIVLR